MIMFKGNPLSSFVSLLCSKGLNGLMFKAAGEGDIWGYSLCSKSPILTHLIFVDDSLLFCKANQQDWRKIPDILETYWKWSGQQINTSKTTIFLSHITLEDSKQFIKEALGILEIRQYEKYLGLPSLIGRNKKASFHYIKEKVWKKLQD